MSVLSATATPGPASAAMDFDPDSPASMSRKCSLSAPAMSRPEGTVNRRRWRSRQLATPPKAEDSHGHGRFSEARHLRTIATEWYIPVAHTDTVETVGLHAHVLQAGQDTTSTTRSGLSPCNRVVVGSEIPSTSALIQSLDNAVKLKHCSTAARPLGSLTPIRY